MIHFDSTTVSEGYRELLRAVSTHGRRCNPRGHPCFEFRDAVLQVWKPDSRPVVTRDEERNEKIARYTEKEFELYAKGESRVEEFAKAAPFWREVADDGAEHINSAYGKIVWFDQMPNGMTPWEWARDRLCGDLDTRQATLLVTRPDHFRETKDIVCTLHGQFSVADDRLHLCMVMRSNDLVKGFPYDAAWFCHLLERMAGECQLTVGTYTHMAHSLHVYERDMDILRRMVG